MVRVPTSDEFAVFAARRLRRAILCKLGLASPLVLAVGCTPAPPGPAEDEGGVTTNPGSNDGNAEAPEGEVGEAGSDSGPSMSEEETGALDETDASTTDGGVKLDVSPISDVLPPPQCWMEWTTNEQLIAEYPDCSLGPFDGNLYVEYFEICVDYPADGDCSSICPPEMLCEGMEACYWTTVFDMCGPYSTPEGCCLGVAGEPPPPIGRPFMVDGQWRLASVDGALCDRVAAHWLEMARGEHASIAAFARFVAILQRLGAPAWLLAEAIAAAADEVRHAEQTLALASWFCGRELSFGPLAIAGAMEDVDDIEAIVRNVVREGCIDETLAAHEAACLAEHAEQPRVAEVLEQIAADEARHAALAWRFVAWMLEQRPQLRSVVVDVFARAQVSGSRSVGMRELVEPCAAQLLQM